MMDPYKIEMKLRFLVTRNWVLLYGLFEVNVTQLTANKSNGPRGQPSVSGHSNVPTKHPITYQSHQWASLELCQKDHLLDDPSWECVVFFVFFAFFFPVFFVLGFRFKPKPVKDKDHFFSHRATELILGKTIVFSFSFLSGCQRPSKSFHSHFKFLRKHLHLFENH